MELVGLCQLSSVLDNAPSKDSHTEGQRETELHVVAGVVVSAEQGVLIGEREGGGMQIREVLILSCEASFLRGDWYWENSGLQ